MKLQVALLLLTLGLAGVLLAICRAPEGWQDEYGFHFGRRP